jgi:dimeric dUTPase (all-alpha-NTP-PPase superfamily)
MLETNIEELRYWFKENDLFVVDGEFRDCLEFLESLGLKNEKDKNNIQHRRQITHA